MAAMDQVASVKGKLDAQERWTIEAVKL